jgi:hypothetical protein
MKKRRWLLIFWIACCLGLMGPLIWQTLSQPRIDMERFEQIRSGMTPTQVGHLIGRPPGNYTHGQVKIIHDAGLEGSSDDYKEWVGEEIAIMVRLDEEGKVSRKEWVPTSQLTRGNRSFLEKLRRLLGL